MKKKFLIHFIFYIFFIKNSLAETKSLYWGDTHVHTNNSVDSYEAGVTNADIDSAYRYAKGLPILHPVTKMKIQIDRPLDFLVIADHAELLRLQKDLEERNPYLLNTESGKRLLKILEKNPETIFDEIVAIDLEEKNLEILEDLYTSSVRIPAWDKQIDAAERYNEPGYFSAFIGWEYTGNIQGKTAHRVVLTPADGVKAKNFLPFTQYDSRHPEDLWKFLSETKKELGIDFLAIPHNSNLSSGIAFDTIDSYGEPLTPAYAASRMTWEKVAEITQYKGTSETHPKLSPNDEFANHEIRDKLFEGDTVKGLEGSYLRSGLLRGLQLEENLKKNPYQFGFIGSTDTHTGLSSVSESNFLGKTGLDILPNQRIKQSLGLMSAWSVSASGRAAVWARENTRKAIFEALISKETYATTGPRIVLQIFGGFNFKDGDDKRENFSEYGYEIGVPMGSEVFSDFNDTDKRFGLIIKARKDPIGANLDRIQVIKGWNSNGQIQEKIFNVAWSDDRSLNSRNQLPILKSTVDIDTATYGNEIGSDSLSSTWFDPEFNPHESSFYYVRVLEIPTPRHHLFDLTALQKEKIELINSDQIQERAYSSPIWYKPLHKE